MKGKQNDGPKRDIPERRFRRDILNRIFIRQDREFLESAYPPNPEGVRVLRDDLTDAERKRLRGILKAARKNRGLVQRWKLALLGIIVAGIVLFNLLFKDMLIARAAERGLESLFGAAADIDDLSFSLLGGQLRFGSLEVADRANPMRNLFQLGPTEVRVDMEALLSGKVVLHRAVAHDIAWGTPRERSGALAAAAPAGGGAAGALPEIRIPTIEDIRELVQEQREKLTSERTAREAAATVEAIVERWDDRIEESADTLENVAEDVRAVTEIRIEDLDTVEKVQEAVRVLQEAAEAVNTVQSAVEDIGEGVREDAGRVEEAGNAVARALEADYAYLSSLVALPEGGVRSLVYSLAEPYLRAALGSFYDYAVRGWEVAMRLKERAPEKADDPRERGIDVPYPTVGYPKYLLGLMDISVGNREQNEFIEGTLRNLSSDPNLLAEPVSFELGKQEGERRLAVDGVIDTREERDLNVRLALDMNEYPLSLSEGLEIVGLERLTGDYSLDGELVQRPDGSAEGTLRFLLTDLDPVSLGGESAVTSVVSDILRESDEVRIEAAFTVSDSGELSLSGSSNLDRLIADAVGEYIGQVRSEYEEVLRNEIRGRAEEPLAAYRQKADTFGDVRRQAGEQLDQAELLKNRLEERQRQLEGRIEAIRKQAESRLKQEAEKQLDRAAEKIRDALKIPGF